MKYLKTFEELSPELADRAKQKSLGKIYTHQENEGEYGITDPLDYKKRKQQYNKFSSYQNPAIRQKLNEAGFGYFQDGGQHVITWSEGRVDKLSSDSKLTILVYKAKYEITKGDLQEMPENEQRKLSRAIKWLQEQIGGGKKENEL